MGKRWCEVYTGLIAPHTHTHLMLFAAVSSPDPWEDSTFSWKAVKYLEVSNLSVQSPQLKKHTNRL
jgi:hypothetical protein